MKKLTVIAIIIISFILTEPVFAQYSGGSGTPADPWQIATANDLLYLAEHTEDYNSHFILTADINLADFTFMTAVIAPDTNNIQPDFQGTVFTGTFDGNDHLIRNLTIDTDSGNDFLGLFGKTGPKSRINNLGIEDVNVTSIWTHSYCIGGLVAENNEGTLSNCYATGSVMGGAAGGSAVYIGGLVGCNWDGTISNCYATGAVAGGFVSIFLGGLVGGNYGIVNNCYATSVVIDGVYLGGLVGGNFGTLSNCYAIGDVISFVVTGGQDHGGLVGFNDEGTISNCYATGSVTGDGSLGGLVGSNHDGMISNCYAIGSVSGDQRVGGLVGQNTHGTISNCYAAGLVDGNDYIGGLVGRNSGMVSASFWDMETSGQATSDGGEGKTKAEMQTMSTFFGWGCEPCVWTIDEGNDYPRLVWENRPGEPISPTLSDLLDGTGTQNDPYLIYTAEQLNMIGLFMCPCEVCFRLMADIDLGSFLGTQFNIIPIFRGVFDGNGHTISNFTYTTADSSSIGIFGYIDDPNTKIKDVTLIDSDVNATWSNCVGSLVGLLSSGMIHNCSVEGGSVLAYHKTGGLAGWSINGTISNCFATATVSGNSDTGGLVGENQYGTISNCYTIGSVSGDEHTGGLVGRNVGTIENCYATGGILGYFFTGGLVGSNYGMISNCCVEGGWIEGNNGTGGLVGHNSAAISNCYATGTVKGETNTGGLVGGSYWSEIWNCYARGDVNGHAAVGGLVGYNNNGTISNCYAKGSASGNYHIGGLVGGFKIGAISNCYAAGAIDGNDYTGGLVGYHDSGSYTSCFWDNNINPDVNGIGNTTSLNVIGKTTAKMQTMSTFTDAGWDFVGEASNGSDNIWTIKEDVIYPQHVWELVNLVQSRFPLGWYEVDFVDFAAMANWWRHSNCAANNDCNSADFDFSGGIDAVDLDAFCSYWLEGTEP